MLTKGCFLVFVGLEYWSMSKFQLKLFFIIILPKCYQINISFFLEILCFFFIGSGELSKNRKEPRFISTSMNLSFFSLLFLILWNGLLTVLILFFL
jgi:hypothetical protein